MTEELRLCVQCQQWLLSTKFSFFSKGVRKKKCRGCRGEHNYPSAKRVRDRGSYRRDWNKQRRVALGSIVIAAKNRPCADCGMRYPSYVMDFDHRDRHQKSFGIAVEVGRNVALERLHAEIAKCDIVCANCHRERTHGPKKALAA